MQPKANVIASAYWLFAIDNCGLTDILASLKT